MDNDQEDPPPPLIRKGKLNGLTTTVLAMLRTLKLKELNETSYITCVISKFSFLMIYIRLKN